MLTTVDNPYNPYKDWDKWYQWDCDHHYFTCQLLARICEEVTDSMMDDEEQSIQYATNIIIENDASHVYAIINEQDETPLNEYFYMAEINEMMRTNNEEDT